MDVRPGSSADACRCRRCWCSPSRSSGASYERPHPAAALLRHRRHFQVRMTPFGNRPMSAGSTSRRSPPVGGSPWGATRQGIAALPCHVAGGARTRPRRLFTRFRGLELPPGGPVQRGLRQPDEGYRGQSPHEDQHQPAGRRRELSPEGPENGTYVLPRPGVGHPARRWASFLARAMGLAPHRG